jgi:hypothetical protein
METDELITESQKLAGKETKYSKEKRKTQRAQQITRVLPE